jgi:hypothetical protein
MPTRTSVPAPKPLSARASDYLRQLSAQTAARRRAVEDAVDCAYAELATWTDAGDGETAARPQVSRP